jgi:hypothetical protein
MDKKTFDAIYRCVRRWWANESPILRESVEILYPGVFNKFVAMYEPVAWMNEYKEEQVERDYDRAMEGDVITEYYYEVAVYNYWGDIGYGR